MTKQEFLERLKAGLSGLPQADIEERLRFYSEMIDDRMEDGLSEEESVQQTGNPEKIAERIISETPITRIVREKVRNRRPLGVAAIILLILLFPVWFPILITILSVLFGLFIAIFAILFSLWVTDFAFALSGPGLVIGSIIYFVSGNVTRGFLALSGAFIMAGLAVLMFFACKAISKATIRLVRAMALTIRKIILGKEN